jgi:hypothetical protein
LDAFDQLNLVAEISAALIGFIAVFLALSKSDGRFAESDRHFIQALVITSALAIVYALVPRSISLFNDNESIWRTASILAVILGSAAMVVQARQQIRMSRSEAADIHWLWHFVAWALSVSIAVLFVLALLDGTKSIAYYVSGVSMMVPLSLWVFVGVVFRRFF